MWTDLQCPDCGTEFEGIRALALHMTPDPTTVLSAHAVYARLSAATVEHVEKGDLTVGQLPPQHRAGLLRALFMDAESLTDLYLLGFVLAWEGDEDSLRTALQPFNDVDSYEEALAQVPLVRALLRAGAYAEEFDPAEYLEHRAASYQDGAIWN